ncbi:WXG100 family type VII secretion target [Paenibacillus terrigena]|uniref:WXG100 family type VII secretion target n=1 Tax=Paenibacillus terrigena TaxID=369333 RepID=UPI0028D6101D|nr:WXG100 family type VII secretion target [Paenibacillus terrigena]
MSMGPSDIHRSASQIYQLTQDVRKESSDINKEIASASLYWSGLASLTFQQEAREIDANLTKQLTQLENLVEVMRQLANDVRRADEEREEKKRTEAAALAAAAAQKSNKP